MVRFRAEHFPGERFAADFSSVKNRVAELLPDRVFDGWKPKHVVPDSISVDKNSFEMVGKASGYRALSGSNAAENADNQSFVSRGHAGESSEGRQETSNPLREETMNDGIQSVR